MKNKPYISASQLESLSRCGEAYRRKYLEKDRSLPGIAAIVGSGVHGAAQHNFEQKIITHVDLPVDEAVDAGVAQFDIRLQDGVQPEPGENMAKLQGKARDETRRLIRFFMQRVAPDYQPIAVEKDVLVQLPGETHDLYGVLDVITHDGQIVDFKTTKKMNAGDAQVSVQLSAYAVMYRKVYGAPPSKLKLEYTVKRAVQPERVTIETTRNNESIASFAARFRAASAQINAGIFAPTDPRNWWCSQKFCSYYATCPFVRGLKGPQGD